MDILAPRKKNWCGHFSANIIGQFSAVHMYIVLVLYSKALKSLRALNTKLRNGVKAIYK
jgi:hypothetical protein